MTQGITRRTFVKGAIATAGLTAAQVSRAAGANERIRLGVIGTANRGGQLVDAILYQKDAEIVGLCDVHGQALTECARKFEDSPKFYSDYRRLLERDDIDAIVIATPDHWHALQMVDACDTGKDVYVEKPLSMTIVEGRRMVEAARRNNRIVQVGTQRRSSRPYADLREFIQDGGIGKVTVARAYRISNMYPNGFGKAPDSDPPEDLDWDMWLGPRAWRPYNPNITPYKFRWWKNYSSQLGNWGVHYFDVIRWMLNEDAPVRVAALGGQFAVDDDRTVPDTLETIFQMPSGCLIQFGQYEASGTPMFRYGEIELRGTKGTVYADQRGYRVVPASPGQFQNWERIESEKISSGKGDTTWPHVRNFLDCVKSRKRPNADVEEGHRSTVFTHLGNIALDLNLQLEWDAGAERITNSSAANVLLHYEYRKPWKLA